MANLMDLHWPQPAPPETSSEEETSSNGNNDTTVDKQSAAAAAGPQEHQDSPCLSLALRSRPFQQPPKQPGLILLPQEILDAILSYLSPAHIVLLALVNKEFMGRFMHGIGAPGAGSQSPGPPWDFKALGRFIEGQDSSKAKYRGQLLNAVDYDLTDRVYCYKCKIIHDPFKTFVMRAFAPEKHRRCIDYDLSHHMPPRSARKLLRTITKRRNHGLEYRHLLQQVNNTNTVYRTGHLIQTTLRMRYRQNCMLLRRQQVLSSIDKTSLALWVFKMQLTGLAGSDGLDRIPKPQPICTHLKWINIFEDFPEQLLNLLCRTDCKNPHSAGELHYHDFGCFDSNTADITKQPANILSERLSHIQSSSSHTSTPTRKPMDVPHLLGAIGGCEKCSTDYQLDVIQLPAPFEWGFVLRTYIDLGEIDFSNKYDSHRGQRQFREFSRTEGLGDICEAFEDLDRSDGSSRDFCPHLDPLSESRLKNYGWAQRAREGRDKYVSWETTHSVDMQTGKIMDPDPLEEADY